MTETTMMNTSSRPTPEKEKKRRALVIGAGPSGLVCAKYLLSSSLSCDVTVLEVSSTIGGTFVNKVYDDTKLVSSKYLTTFSDYRMGRNVGDHPTAEEYVAYLKGYCDVFGLWDVIRFRCDVVEVRDAHHDHDDHDHDHDDDTGAGAGAGAGGDGHVDEDEEVDAAGYFVTYRCNDDRDNGARGTKEETAAATSCSSDASPSSAADNVRTEHFDIVAVCTGLHNVPYTPHIRNIDKFRGTVLHSSRYRTPSAFDGKRVLVLGSGETAMDIALRAVRNDRCASVAMSVRRGFLSIPHSITEGRPLDVFITNLFEHSYEHPWVHRLRLRWILSTLVIRAFLWLAGSSWGFNQWCCPTSPIRRGYHIINKSHGAMSHLNVVAKSKSMWGRMWMRIYGEVGLRPIWSFHRTKVERIDDNDDDNGDGNDANKEKEDDSAAGAGGKSSTVRFDDGRTYRADFIVMATGYRQSFPFLCRKIREEYRKEYLDRFGSEETLEKENDSDDHDMNVNGEKSELKLRMKWMDKQEEEEEEEKIDLDSCNGGGGGGGGREVGSSTVQVLDGVGSDSTKRRDDCNYKIEEDYLPTEHFIVGRRRPRLGFIGFVRPNVGAIPPMSELQVMWWLANLQGNIVPLHRRVASPPTTPPPDAVVHTGRSGGGNKERHFRRRRLRPLQSPPPTYMVLGRKYRYGVDYGNYMHRVAEDMDAAPTLSCLLLHPFRRSDIGNGDNDGDGDGSSDRGKNNDRTDSFRTKIKRSLVALYTYCQGQAYVPFFRLRGPYASDRCWDVVTNELWKACIDRGWMENFGLLVVTWMSLWMNLTACLFEVVWCLFTARMPEFFVRYG